MGLDLALSIILSISIYVGSVTSLRYYVIDWYPLQIIINQSKLLLLVCLNSV